MTRACPGPPVIGLTGGIGSGKSAAADAFAGHGAVIVDSDRIAHELTAAGGAAMAEIGAAFGPRVVDASGALDRAAMRALAFSQPEARTRLEGILHPLIRAVSAARVAEACAQADTPYVMLVVPLLVESGRYAGQLARICVVDCPPALQIERVMARNGLPRAQVLNILAAQADRAQRLAVADDVIDNSGDLRALHERVATLDAAYRKLRTGHCAGPAN